MSLNLAYAIYQISFIDLAIIAKTIGLANMSDTSWRKRLLKIIPFLEIIISFMIKTFVKTDTIQDAPRLMLVDATNVRLQGKDQYLEPVEYLKFALYSRAFMKIHKNRIFSCHQRDASSIFKKMLNRL